MSHRLLTPIVLFGAIALALGAFLSGRALGQESDRPQEDGAPAPAAVVTTSASVGSTFTYQGSLRDNGAPYDGACDFDFRLYDAVAGGNQVGSNVLLTNQKVSGGLFTVPLDFGSDAFIGEARWLEIRVRCPAGAGDYAPLTPRQALTAAPYALGLQPGAVIDDAIAEPLLTLQNGVGHALVVSSAGASGVAVTLAGGHGVYVGSVGDHGVVVDWAGGYGVVVGSAGDDGVIVGSAGEPNNHVFSPDKNGFEVVGAEGSGFLVGHANIDGVYVYEADRNGVYANTLQGAGEWGLFTPDKISASNVTASSMTLVAQVGDATALEPGTVVAAVGTAPPLPDSGERLALVAPAGGGNAAGIVGVVEGRMVLERDQRMQEGAAGGAAPEPWMLRSAPGPAQPGDYVALTIAGVAQVRLSPEMAVAEGERLTAAAGGMARPLQQLQVALAGGGTATMTEQAPTIGVALSEVDEKGLVWVLVNPQ